MADVSAKLLGQFVDCLETKLLVDVGRRAATCRSAAETRRPARSRRRTQLLARRRADHGPLDLASEGAAAARALDRRPTTAGAVGRSTASARASGARVDGTSGPQVKVVDSPEPEPVDLLDAAGAPVVKRAAPVVAGLTVLWLLSVFLRRRRRRASAEPAEARLGAVGRSRYSVPPCPAPSGQPRRSGGIGRRARLRA